MYIYANYYVSRIANSLSTLFLTAYRGCRGRPIVINSIIFGTRNGRDGGDRDGRSPVRDGCAGRRLSQYRVRARAYNTTTAAAVRHPQVSARRRQRRPTAADAIAGTARRRRRRRLRTRDRRYQFRALSQRGLPSIGLVRYILLNAYAGVGEGGHILFSRPQRTDYFLPAGRPADDDDNNFSRLFIYNRRWTTPRAHARAPNGVAELFFEKRSAVTFLERTRVFGNFQKPWADETVFQYFGREEEVFRLLVVGHDAFSSSCTGAVYFFPSSSSSLLF